VLTVPHLLGTMKSFGSLSVKAMRLGNVSTCPCIIDDIWDACWVGGEEPCSHIASAGLCWG